MKIKEKEALLEMSELIREVNENLKKFLLILPEESLEDYKNKEDIKKAFYKATRQYMPDK